MNTEAFSEHSPRHQWEKKYRGNLFLLEQDNVKGFERAVRPPGVRLIIQNKKGEILLTREIRPEQGGHDFRLPGGKVFDNIGPYLEVRDDEALLQEAVIDAAINEAREEAGVENINNLELIKRSSNGATIEWDLFFLKGEAEEFGEQKLHGDEAVHGIERKFYSKEEILKMLKRGDIKEDRTVAVLYTQLLKDK